VLVEFFVLAVLPKANSIVLLLLKSIIMSTSLSTIYTRLTVLYRIDILQPYTIKQKISRQHESTSKG